jgi:hypothetical protein
MIRCAIGAVLMSALATASGAQEMPPAPSASLEKCAATTSLEGRLVMEQWTRDSDCARPVRTRVTDRFLGYSCLEESPGMSTCRAFVPPPGSQAFDTAKVFRCVDIALAENAAGAAIVRMREWAAATRQCDWSQARGVLAMEVDFVRAEICTAGLCIGAERLSAIGKTRLGYLIEKTRREFGLIGSTASAHNAAASGGN